jgi:hypothetical protein
MSKHPLDTKVKEPSAKVVKAFAKKEMDAFEKSHPKPDPEILKDDPEAYISKFTKWSEEWRDYVQTPEYQDKFPKSANRLAQEKFEALADRIDIALGSDQFWNLWEEVKDLKGFQVTGGPGSRSRNTEGDTQRIDMFKMSVVADYMHRKGVNQTTAIKQISIDKELLKPEMINPSNLSTLINQKYPWFWELLMEGRTAEKDEDDAITDGQGGWKIEGKVAAARCKKQFKEMLKEANN